MPSRLLARASHSDLRPGVCVCVCVCVCVFGGEGGVLGLFVCEGLYFLVQGCGGWGLSDLNSFLLNSLTGLFQLVLV